MNSNKWCRTVDGEEINLFDPDPSLFTVDRIANALARINRFAGHWERPVSVARHSVRVADRLRADGCDIETQLQGLFHDAAEAFTTDIPTPLKRLLSIRVPSTSTQGRLSFDLSFEVFEDDMLCQIFAYLEIEWPLRLETEKADKLLTENEKPWVVGKECTLYRGVSADPAVVAETFKRRAEELFNERAHANDVPTER